MKFYYTVTILSGPCTDNSYILGSEPCGVGRAPTNDVAVRDKLISRNHGACTWLWPPHRCGFLGAYVCFCCVAGTFEVTRGRGVVVYSDHSQNGTYVQRSNSDRPSFSLVNAATVLCAGDMVLMGSTAIKLEKHKGYPSMEPFSPMKAGEYGVDRRASHKDDRLSLDTMPYSDSSRVDRMLVSGQRPQASAPKQQPVVPPAPVGRIAENYGLIQPSFSLELADSSDDDNEDKDPLPPNDDSEDQIPTALASPASPANAPSRMEAPVHVEVPTVVLAPPVATPAVVSPAVQQQLNMDMKAPALTESKEGDGSVAWRKADDKPATSDDSDGSEDSDDASSDGSESESESEVEVEVKKAVPARPPLPSRPVAASIPVLPRLPVKPVAVKKSIESDDDSSDEDSEDDSSEDDDEDARKKKW